MNGDEADLHGERYCRNSREEACTHRIHETRPILQKTPLHYWHILDTLTKIWTKVFYSPCPSLRPARLTGLSESCAPVSSRNHSCQKAPTATVLLRVLCRRCIPPDQSHWFLAGGWMGVGHPLSRKGGGGGGSEAIVILRCVWFGDVR